MNEEMVKKLTRKGIVIDKEAAERLDPETTDLILCLDTPPMYLTPEMLDKLQSSGEPA